MGPKRVTYHVTPRDGDWAAKRAGTKRAANVYDNKEDAIERAKELAKKEPLGQVKIHDKHGDIQTEHTYRKDPYPPKG